MTGGTTGSAHPVPPVRVRLLVAAWALLVALNLRPALASVGPVLPELRGELGLSRAVAGLLTTVPVLCFGLLAPLAPRLGRRTGLELALAASMAVLAAGIGLRSLGGTAALACGTLVVGAAITAGNVLVPPLVKTYLPGALGLMTGLFTTGLTGGAALSGGLTGLAVDTAGWGWRVALGVWALPALVAVLVWLPLRHHRERGAGPGAVPAPERHLPVWRSPMAWGVAVFMGVQALGFYSMLAWLPEILLDAGFSTAVSSLALVLFNLLGIATSLTVPPAATRRDSQVPLVLVTCAGWAGGAVGLAVWPAGALGWAVVLGLAQGAGVSLAMTLMSLKATTPAVARDLSGMAQGVGYTVAATGPFLLGWLRDLSGGWTLPLLVLVLLVVGMAVGGSVGSRPGHVR